MGGPVCRPAWRVTRGGGRNTLCPALIYAAPYRFGPACRPDSEQKMTKMSGGQLPRGPEGASLLLASRFTDPCGRDRVPGSTTGLALDLPPVQGRRSA